MNIFLTGGTGFIGQPLTRALLDRRWNVTALVRDSQSPWTKSLGDMGAELAVGDITDRESMRKPMSSADIVVHNAGHYEFGVDPSGARNMQSVNVDGTENVLSLAEELGIDRTIYVSTVWAYGYSGAELRDETFTRNTPVNSSYEKTKAEAHEVAVKYQDRGLPVIIVCPNGVIGPNDHSILGHLLRLYLNKFLPPMGWTPESRFTFVDVYDLAQGIALAVEKGQVGETYMLCGEATSMKDMFAIWSKKPGAFKFRLWLPAGLVSLMMWPLEPLQRAVGLTAFLSREAVKAGSGGLYYSSAKAQRELGWRHKSAEEMWFNTIDKELELLDKYREGNLISRLKPLDYFAVEEEE